MARVTDPTVLPTFGGPAQIATHTAPPGLPLRDQVMEVLAAEGFRPQIDEDGDVAVLLESQPVFVRAFDTVPPMLRVSSQWLIGPEIPGGELVHLRACNAMTGVLNLIKTTLLSDRLVVAIDLVAVEGADLHLLLPAAMQAVKGSVATWHSTVLQLLEEMQPS